MNLSQSKKGAELSTLAEIILLLIAAGLILGIFEYAASRASEGTSENLCRGFNAIRFGTKVDKGPITLNLAPRACKTLDKKDLPNKNYEDYPGGTREGAKAELRDMVAKCWWMWLEGRQGNVFDTSTLNPQNKCFVCYTFSLKNGADIKIPEFKSSLDYPYQAADVSNKCAAGGEGGFCRPSCDNTEIDVNSATCPTGGAKCCISKGLRDECINKGGICSITPQENYKYYPKWSCGKGSCYVKNENFLTYLDYVQGTKSASGGAGFVVYEKAFEEPPENPVGLTTKKKYAVTFISPGNTPGWSTVGWGAGTIIIGGAGAFVMAKWGTLIAAFSPALAKALVVATITGVYSTAEMTHKSGTPAGYNFIYVSEYDRVSNKCFVEAGVGD